MSSEQQKEELERILRGIYKRFHGFPVSTLYFAEEGSSTPIDWLLWSPNDYQRMLEFVFSPRVEYSLYIHHSANISPSSDCKKYGLFSIQLIVNPQFFGGVPLYRTDDLEKFIKYLIGISHTAGGQDPLSQVFAYRRVLATRWPQHAYACLRVYHVVPDNPDSASIFHGREGIIAYCMTLRDLALIEISVGIDNVYDQLRDVFESAVRKLANSREVEDNECDIDVIESIIHDEIENANQLMREYGIIRVAFPLR